MGRTDRSAWEYTFAKGEWVVGDLTLVGIGHAGGRLGRIEFKTNLNKEFKKGDGNGRWDRYPSGGTSSQAAYIAGISGAAERDNDIIRVGFIFWKPIRSSALISIWYPTLSSVRLSSPKSVVDRTLCNDASRDTVSPSFSVTRTVSWGEESCFSFNTETTLSLSLTVEASIPFVNSAETTASWSTTIGAGFENCRNRQESTSTTFNFSQITLRPYTRVYRSFSQWQGVLNRLPYVGTMRFTFTDNGRYDKRIEGLYSGVSYTSTYFSNSEETNVFNCR